LTLYIIPDIFTVEVVMKNLYAKKCCWCKVVVQPGEGKIWNYDDKWWVGCQKCLDERFKDEDKEA
jgi:hypothetical protein